MYLKKLVLVIGILTMASDMKSQPQHEIAVSYGFPTIAFVPNQNCDPNCDDFNNAFYGPEREFGPLSIEYYHRSSRWISWGGIFNIIRINKDIKQMEQNGHNSQKIGDYSEHYYSLMPAVKFNFLRGEFIGLYSKVALGVCLSPKSTCGTDIEDVKVEKTKLRVGPMYHLTLLGMEIGGRLRAFGEFGIGAKGVLSAGLRYQF